MSRGPGAKGGPEKETKKEKKKKEGKKKRGNKIFQIPDGGPHPIYPYESK